MAVQKAAGQAVIHVLWITNQSDFDGRVKIAVALGVENLLKRWTTHEGTTVWKGGDTGILIKANYTQRIDIAYIVPPELPKKGYGAMAWLIDPETGQEIDHRVIGEAVEVV